MQIRNLCSVLLLTGAVVTTSRPAEAQQQGPPATNRPSASIGLMYSAGRSNPVNGRNFWLEGGTAEIAADVTHGLGIALNVNGSHASKINSLGADLTTITITVGPRYTWKPRSDKFEVFGEGLVGDARGTNSIFPTPVGVVSDIDAFALQVGGGLNLHLSPKVSVRAVQADWIRTQFPNGTTDVQNSLRLGAGLVFRLP